MGRQNYIIIAVGVFIVYWAQTHSPEAGIGQITKNFFNGSYTMSQNWYYASMGLGVILVVYGLLKMLKVIK